VKYVAWLNKDQKYKCHLISKLTDLQYHNFLILFVKNKTQTEYILFKKLYILFDSCNLGVYEEKEIIKLNEIAKNISLESTVELFDRINYQNINTHNAKKILLYLRDENNFKKNKINIGWGPGNHGDPITNIEEHFIKHVLSEEGMHWKLLLDKISCDSYKKYAIDAFYKMKNVIVHTDGTNVYLSGFYENVFIIGRYHNDIFGISSCYYVENGEKNGRYKGICFKLILNELYL